jgi:hypothetical protein
MIEEVIGKRATIKTIENQKGDSKDTRAAIAKTIEL